MTLIEMSVTLAISGVIMGPLAGIMAIQIRAPVKVVSEITTKRQIQKASLVITEDASAAETFELAEEPPDYGTFLWEELSGGDPVPVSVRYFFETSIDLKSGVETGTLFRDIVPGGRDLPPKVWLNGIARFEDVDFQFFEPSWFFDPTTRDWSLDDGKVAVTITQTLEAGAEFEATVTTETVIAHLRPDITRPVEQPSPN